MKGFLLIPVAVITVAGTGFVICRALGLNPHVKEMIAAAGAGLIATMLALTPLMLTRGASQPSIAQAALFSTLIHLFANTTAAAIVLMSRLPLDRAFTYWLMAQYWMTLLALAFVCVRTVKLAPAETVMGEK